MSFSKKLSEFVQQDLFGVVSEGQPGAAASNKIVFSEKCSTYLKSLFDMIVHSAKQSDKGGVVSLSEIDTSVESIQVSTYIPNEIRTQIIQKLKIRRVFQMKWLNRSIKIHFVFSDVQRLSNRFFLDALYRIYLWLSIAFQFSNPQCGNILDIFIYFSDEEKKVPKSKMEPIDQQHVNTAFTTPCKPQIAINIFRKEEWFKVFLHESFHCFGFDFAGMENTSAIETRIIKSYFRLKPDLDIRVYEAYTETWANVIHTLFLAYFSCKTKSWTNVYRYFTQSLKHEQIFSVFQCCKVLDHNKLSYRDVCKGEMQSYRENSYVFAYYIMKSALLYHIDEFVGWCISSHGPTNVFSFTKKDAHIQRFCKLLIDFACREKYVETVLKMEKWYEDNIDKKKYSQIQKTMRMTVYG